jgi:hypothetical protein
MLRLIHNQVNLGALLVDDIDDGLPNKTAHRLGSVADPKAYVPDGYANKPKQPCYIPYNKHLAGVIDPTLPGFIDVFETERVTHSAGKGKIYGLAQATSQRPALITVVSFVEADLTTPVVTNAVIGVVPADLTITGTGFLSLTPNDSTVYITGTGAVAPLTRLAILAAGGTAAFSDTSIVIPAALVPAIASPGTFVQVKSDDKLSNIFTV